MLALSFREASMGSISVRQLDDEVLTRLRGRAGRHGVSMEEEVRRILEAAVKEPERIGDRALESFGEAHGVEFEMPRHEPHEPIDPGR